MAYTFKVEGEKLKRYNAAATATQHSDEAFHVESTLEKQLDHVTADVEAYPKTMDAEAASLAVEKARAEAAANAEAGADDAGKPIDKEEVLWQSL